MARTFNNRLNERLQDEEFKKEWEMLQMEQSKTITEIIDQKELDEFRKGLEQDGWIKFQEDGVFISKEACLLNIATAIIKDCPELKDELLDVFCEAIEHLETFLKICQPDNWE